MHSGGLRMEYEETNSIKPKIIYFLSFFIFCWLCISLQIPANNQLDALFHVFISSVYMFRASQCSSSGDRIVLIHHLVWLVCVSDCLVCPSGSNRHTKPSLTQTNHTRWCINTILSPDDERCDARNMERDEINKYMKNCFKLVFSKNL